jgi:glycosyltransferase involved in cell wall biosynthesis
VDERFHPGAETRRARERFGLTRPYVLAVGTASARKDIDALEAPAAALRERGIELVVAGSTRGYLRGGGSGRLRRLGYVPDDLMPGLYAGARALAMPSRYEGFGLPCLEAMASGTPVVAAPRAALPETCGGAALMAEPPALTDALLSAASDGDVRAQLIPAGLARAAQLPWSRTAELTDAAIAELLH